MRPRFSFSLRQWLIGLSFISDIPLSGYIDGVEYMAAVKNDLVSIFLGPFVLHLWLGPQPQETPEET